MKSEQFYITYTALHELLFDAIVIGVHDSEAPVLLHHR